MFNIKIAIRIEPDLNKLLKILENPIRRKIIERLSQEFSYALQLSKDLSLSQQLVAKHLKTMEHSGMVNSYFASSPSGPRRKLFGLAKSFSIVLDVAPHLFKQNIFFFDVEPKKNEMSGTMTSLMERRDKILDYPPEKDKIITFSQLLADIDRKLDILQQERMLLLSVRNYIMKEASEVIQRIDDADARRVFRPSVDEHDKSIKRISKSLNLREETVRQIVQKLKTEFKTEYFL